MSFAANPVDDGIALLSIQHIVPEYEDEIVQTCDLLDDLGLSSYTLLAIPFFRMKRSNTFQKHELFTEYLLSLGKEISMLGYSHMTKSGTDAEFRRMPQKQVKMRISQGKSLIRQSFKKNPIGFFPPLWESPQSTISVTKDLNFRYCVIGNSIYDFSSDVNHITAHYILGHGTNAHLKSDAFLELELGGPVQVAIHPVSFHSERIYELVYDMKDRLGYTFVGYADYLDRVR